MRALPSQLTARALEPPSARPDGTTSWAPRSAFAATRLTKLEPSVSVRWIGWRRDPVSETTSPSACPDAELGNELYCRVCGDGGDILGCDKCKYSICKRCIQNVEGNRGAAARRLPDPLDPSSRPWRRLGEGLAAGRVALLHLLATPGAEAAPEARTPRSRQLGELSRLGAWRPVRRPAVRTPDALRPRNCTRSSAPNGARRIRMTARRHPPPRQRRPPRLPPNGPPPRAQQPLPLLRLRAARRPARRRLRRSGPEARTSDSVRGAAPRAPQPSTREALTPPPSPSALGSAHDEP